MTHGPVTNTVPIAQLEHAVGTQINAGARFGGLFASALGEATQLMAVLSLDGALHVERAVVGAGAQRYPSLSQRIPSARWYEREIHDLFGLEATGHRGLDPLVFAFSPDSSRPRPGAALRIGAAHPDLSPPPAHLRGEGVFTMSYGPVRSGVFESIEYVIETSGESIPLVRTRVSYKHRGMESRFEGLNVNDGVLLAERYEGVASVAHALAFCGAVEQIGDVVVSRQAGLVRVMHAELERIANHLDSTVRHTEAAGQAVAYARFSLHKERVQRLRAELCGSRFGRGVVVPGGVTGPPTLDAGQIQASLASLAHAIDDDTTLLMDTPSFLDRLRGTGVLSTATVIDFAAVGPVARASGQLEDVRRSRPYAAYAELGPKGLTVTSDGDALARQRVRIQEIKDSFEMIDAAVRGLEESGAPDDEQWARPVAPSSGTAIGWAEAPQGELLTLVAIREGSLVRVKPRSASFQNLALFPAAFPNDILTDFAFIEASFGLSIAGVAG
jgi:Ni,Fe-hydrogenase III large subunit